MIDTTKLWNKPTGAPQRPRTPWLGNNKKAYIPGSIDEPITYPEAPSPFLFPKLPNVSGITGIPSQMLIDLWQTWNRRPEYRNPEYEAWRKQYPNAPEPKWAGYSGWGPQDPTVIYRHVKDVWGMTPEQAKAVAMAFGTWYPKPRVKTKTKQTQTKPIIPQVLPPTNNAQPSGETGILPPGESYYGGYPPTTTPFPYPSELQTASNVFSRFAYGLPTDVGQWWEAQQPVFERRISDLAKQQAEQAGLAGLRWSTPLQRNITDIVGREANKLWADLAAQQLGLTEAAKNRAMQAAGALPSIAQMRFQMPMSWAQQIMGMGGQAQALQQAALGRQYQEFLRTMPEASPWIRAAMGFLGLPSQMVPQQYTPSLMSQILGLGAMIPMIAGL